MSVTAGVSVTVIAIRDKLIGKIGQTKVKRYWPGKAPEWSRRADDEVDEDGDIRMLTPAASAFPTQYRKDDPRLRRLAESRIDNRDDVRADHRRIRRAEIVSTHAEEDSRWQEEIVAEQNDPDALDERRLMIKEKLRERNQEEVQLRPPEEDVDESDEYSTDSEEEVELLSGMAMLKPVFVPKAERDTISESERIEARKLEIEEERKKKLEERKKETKQIVVEEILKDEEILKSMDEKDAKIADVKTDDEVHEAEEYEAWKAREIDRIKRDRDHRAAMIKEKVKNMTEEERTAAPKRKRNQYLFLQKYYHKGAFFQSDADDHAGTAGTYVIFSRDYSAPTGEDKMNKTILPSVMQVKNFGRRGRTKWTHLVNEDTTDWNDPLQAKYNAKMAGMNTAMERPKGSNKQQG